MKMPACSGGHDLVTLKPTLMVCRKCGVRLGFAPAKKVAALVTTKTKEA